MASLETQIRRFLEDIGGRTTMALPPMEKEARKRVHELAQAFGLKSQSKGKGENRYTTLSKTSRSGVAIREKKVNKILRQAGAASAYMGAPGGFGKGGAARMPKHKEGEEVGKAAPKIGETNIGFRMLASMGWHDGERIGRSGGIDVPIAAVIKHSKRGLGHTAGAPV
jgi:hypothetical protein